MSDWQPIETLVDDSWIGRAILVWVPKNLCIFAVVPYQPQGREFIWWGDRAEKFTHTATHWMPLPDPPSTPGDV